MHPENLESFDLALSEVRRDRFWFNFQITDRLVQLHKNCHLPKGGGWYRASDSIPETEKMDDDL